jgi:uncharacterized protein (TIGR00288 family)
MNAASSRAGRVALLIDADNPSADVIEQAVEGVLEAYGAIHVRRAYCSLKKAAEHEALFKRLLVRPCVNLSLGKNCNDIALAVDAMDLLVRERPDTVVVLSSDSDFAPLVLRLKEAGCLVVGIGQEGKTGDSVQAMYDEFVVLAHRKPSARKAAASPTSRRTRPPAAPPAVQEEASPPPAPVAAPAKRGRARAAGTAEPRRPARAPAAATPPAPPPLPQEVQQVIDALPELLAGEPVELRVATQRLRQGGLLAKTAPSTRLFKKYPLVFVLTPEQQPNAVRYRMGQSLP